MNWKVHKFGGTSVANAERYRNVGRVVCDLHQEKSAVVVSAMAGVTNALIELVTLASARDAAHTNALRSLRRKVLECVAELLDADASKALVERFESDFNDIEDVLRALWLLQSKPDHALDLISGFGELWSAQMLGAYLQAEGKSAVWLDARDVLVVEPGPSSPYVDWDQSQAKIDAWLAAKGADIVVITGFIATGADGVPTTLGRNGSDYSASIFGALLNAEVINIWTDVDGVMSADPRKVSDAIVLGAMSYHEAMELAYFGAKVIHPSTMAPAVSKEIPIYIRNSLNPEVPGTRIHTTSPPGFYVKGLATVDDMALVNVEGTSMIGVPGIASRLFSALREAGVSVVMISQGSSEHSICFVVPRDHADRSVEAVEEAFFAERHHGQIQTIEVLNDCSILALVGDNMAGATGIAARFFGALGNAGVNIRAIAQGSSERNISVVIDTKDATRSLRAVHSGFYLGRFTISIGVIGAGVVGSTLLDQLAVQAPQLVDEIGVDLRVRAIATSKKMIASEQPLDLSSWRTEMESDSVPMDIDAFVRHVHSDAIPHAVIVDCSSSQKVADQYAQWLEDGIHVITPNKKASSSDMMSYIELKETTANRGSHFLYETTVGAGLPIIQTLQDLVRTGDHIYKIEGIFSGTLSYLFNSYDGSQPFSEIVKQAKELGYTEPDPRDDLNGMDVARKLVILAREMGLSLEVEDVDVQGLVPDELGSLDIPTFLEKLPSIDEAMQARLEAANKAGEILRFVGSVNADGEARVALENYPATHPFGRIQLTDNIVQFTSGRYKDNPLVVQGPGAGPAVTAGGVFADILHLATYLGA